MFSSTARRLRLSVVVSFSGRRPGSLFCWVMFGSDVMLFVCCVHIWEHIPFSLFFFFFLLIYLCPCIYPSLYAPTSTHPLSVIEHRSCRTVRGVQFMWNDCICRQKTPSDCIFNLD